MDKEYFVSINEVAKRLSVPAHTLRYWEKQFPTAIRPTTGAGGRRYYRPETVAKLEIIKSLLYDRGMTIAGVKKMIHDGELSVEVRASKTKDYTPATTTQQSRNVDSESVRVAISYLEQARAILE